MRRQRESALRALLLVPPAFAALYVGGTEIAGSSLWPWNPQMDDFEVYRRTGALVLSGGDFFNVSGLPWIYPPFAALLTVPLAVLDWGLVTALWVLLCAAALAAIIHRLGVSGWRLSLLTTAVILLVAPVRQTIGFGQLGIFLVAVVVLDSMPGPRIFGRRLLPEGWLVGLAAAVKLTPAVVSVYHFFVGKRRQAWTAFAVFVAAFVIGLIALWSPTLYYWLKLGGGDSGTNGGIIYAANQSVLALWARLTHQSTMGGVWLSALVLVLGVWAAVLMGRRGQPRLALALAGLTSLLASPISWSHHYVWVVVLALVLWQERSLPAYYRWPALGYAAWVAVAPFMWLPMGGNLEYSYSWWELLVDDAGIVAGVGLLAGSVLLALGRWGSPVRAASARVVEPRELVGVS